MARTRRQGGLTLVELMVVLAVVGVGALLAAPSFSDSLRRARLADRVSDVVGVLEFAKTEGFKRSNVQVAVTAGSAWNVTAQVTDAGGNVVERRLARSSTGSSIATLLAPTSDQAMAMNFRGLVTGGFISTAACATAADNCLRLALGPYEARVGVSVVGQVAACTVGRAFGGYPAC